MLQVRGLTLEVGGALVLEEASLTVRRGDKVGLVGRNGAGKTSLLQALAGEIPLTGGALVRPAGVGYLRQEVGLRAVGERTAVAHILSGRGLDESAEQVERRRQELERSASAHNVVRFSQAEQAYHAAGGYSGESEARRIAAGLGVPGDRLDLAVRNLSGGERRRVELARILFAGSDLLLLDEPTNHLDTDAKAWLMKFLASDRGGLLVVSHDLMLLDRAITRIVHLDERRLIEYRGTYTQYREAHRRDEERRAKMGAIQQAKIKRLADLADSMRHQTEKRARIAKTLDRRVDRLRTDAVQAPRRERLVRFRFPEPPHCGNLVLEAQGLAKGYGRGPVFEDVGFTVGRGERLLIMGLNGAGKTSLLRILAGVAEPDVGSFRLGAGVSLGYYAQEHEGIAPDTPVIEHMRERSAAPDQELRGLLGMFGLSGDMALQDAGTLSGGEKTKLALAQLVAGRHNLVLLDEPTNNLDPPSLEAVGRALASWQGSIVLVSHDPEFVTELAPDRVLLMPDGVVGAWSDDLLDVVALD